MRYLLPTLILTLLSPTIVASTDSDPDDGRMKLELAYIKMSEKADSLMGTGNWKEAEEVIVSVLRAHPANPANPMLFSNLGVCKYQLRKYSEAVETFDIALVKAPNSTAVLANRARALLAQGNSQAALADLSKALDCDSTLNDLRSLRAFLLLQSGKPDEAYRDFKILTPFIPQDLRVSDYPASLPLSKYDEELLQDYTHLLIGAARSAALSGRKDDASSLYANALALSPDESEAVEGVIHFLETKPDEYTQTSIHQLITKFPESGKLYLAMAAICKRRFLHTECELNKKIAKQYGVDSQTIEIFLTNF